VFDAPDPAAATRVYLACFDLSTAGNRIP